MKPSIRLCGCNAWALPGALLLALLITDCITVDCGAGLVLRGVRVDRRQVRVYERVTIDFSLNRRYDNPFNADQIRIEARIDPPAGPAWSVPGFWIQPYDGGLVAGKPHVEKAGAPHWQVRLSFPAPGEYTVTVTARAPADHASAPPISIRVLPVDVPGRIRRTSEDHRYFVTDRGETFFPVGANVCWAERDWGRGVFAYDHWLARYAAQGCNMFRVFLNSEFTDCALHTPASGFDRIDQRRAWNFDHVLELAEGLHLWVMPVFESFTSLSRNKEFWGFFEQSVYFRGNGGPLDEPEDFFTNPIMKREFRNRLRYAVARWGYSPNLFAWELFNEVDGSENYKSANVAAWHREMADCLRKIDPWHHLISTSLTHPPGDPAVAALPEMDFVMSHLYNDPDFAEALGRCRTECVAARDRPHFFGEFGASNLGGGKQLDPEGICIHNALFASPGQEEAGAPLSWWWDVYIDPLDLYLIWGAFNRWINGFDFVAQHPVKVVAETVYIDPDAPRSPEDVEILPTKRAWAPASFNRPAHIRISRFGAVSGDLPLSALQHGLGGHKPLHNPVTFNVNFSAPTSFVLDVGDVSGYGGARLDVKVDGKLVLNESLTDRPDPKDKTLLRQYRGPRRVPVPAGRHTIRVENTGPDWFEVLRYAFPRSVTPSRPPLRVYGLIGRTQALLWIQNRYHTWFRANRADYQPYSVRGARCCLSRLRPGQWRVERWDTNKGRAVESCLRTVGPDGKLRIDLPDIARDTAYRLYKKP